MGILYVCTSARSWELWVPRDGKQNGSYQELQRRWGSEQAGRSLHVGRPKCSGDRQWQRLDNSVTVLNAMEPALKYGCNGKLYVHLAMIGT